MCHAQAPTPQATRAYASFLVTGTAVASGTSLTFTPQINRGGTLITGGATTTLTLAAGHIYQVNYTVNGTASAAGLVQITPYLNGAAAAYGQSSEVAQAAPNNQFTLNGSFLVDATNAPSKHRAYGIPEQGLPLSPATSLSVKLTLLPLLHRLLTNSGIPGRYRRGFLFSISTHYVIIAK